MAIVKGKFIIGVAGAVIYKTYRGQQVITGKARGTVKITEATKKSANIFGKSSTFACQIRLGLNTIVTKNHDGTMHFRLTQDVARIVNKALDPENSDFYFGPSDFDALTGFQFNIKSPFKQSLLVPPYITVTDNQLTLHQPEINVPKDLKFPLNATSCNINFVVMEFNLLEGTKKRTLIGTKKIENNKGIYAAEEWTAPLQEGWFTVIAISLNYVQQTFAGDVILNSKDFCPAMIVQAGFITNIDQADPFKLETKNYRWAPTK